MSSNTITKSVIAGLIVAAIGVFYIQPWAERRAEAADALRAIVVSGPWSPYPMSANSNVSRAWDREGYTTAVISTIERGNAWSIAQVRVQNPGSQVITNIRLDMRSNPPNMLLLQVTGQPLQRLEAPDELMLPDLAPGQSVSFMIWGGDDMSSRHRYYGWKSYSSAGAIQFTYPDDSLDEFVVEWWMPYAAGGGALLLLVILVGVATAYERYVQRLLANDEFHGAERDRYCADPASFRARLE